MTQPHSRPASEIGVHAFRQIFQWPLVLRTKPGDDAETIAAALDKAAPLKHSAKWTEERNHLATLPGEEVNHAYEEVVYFHDFAQKFLYPTGAEPLFRLWHRKDVHWIDAKIGETIYRFNVERITLHVFRLGTAILTVEVTLQQPCDRPVNLAETQTIIDHLRRSYPAFWNDKDACLLPKEAECSPKEAARSPREVTLLDCQRKPIGQVSRPQSHKQALLHLQQKGHAPIYPHWQALIEPLTIGAEVGQWRDPSDERIPCLSYLSLTGADSLGDAESLELLRDGDWVRLADADEAGSALHPYNPDFMKQFKETVYYDRFFPHEEMRESATRHLFGGAHYAVVGAGWFFDKIILGHFRRHYAQLALIARFEFMMLLTFSSRLTDAVAQRDKCKDGAADFEKTVLTIQDAFLTFTHRFHFTGVSSQVQASEMYDRWGKSLGLRELFDDVQRELEAAAASVRAKQAQREVEASSQLTKIATWGVVLGLIVGALGANVLVGHIGNAEFQGIDQWAQLAIVTSAVLLGMSVLFLLLKRCREGTVSLVLGGLAGLVAVALEWSSLFG